MKVAVIMLTLNEEERIEKALSQFKPYVDYILVVDGESTDKTVEKAQKIADQVVVHKFLGSFAEEKNYARTLVPTDYTWILWVDSDELWDQTFLSLIHQFVEDAEKNYGVCFRFYRINLPDAKNYPDYQIRLFRNSRDIQWKNPTHEIPYYALENVPLDTLDAGDRTKKLAVIVVNECPIIHLPRRQDIKRPWW